MAVGGDSGIKVAPARARRVRPMSAGRVASRLVDWL
jgi:hypothetical protein